MSERHLDYELRKLETMRDLLERIEEAQGSSNLNDWEEDFLSNLCEVVTAGHTLSDAQNDKLDQVEDIAINGRD